MPYTVDWDDYDHTIIYADLGDPWTWEDFVEMFKEIGELAGSVDHRVDVIADAQHQPHLPRGGLKYKRQTIEYIPDNVGLLVRVGWPGAGGSGINISNLALELGGHKMRIIDVESMDKAYITITESRQSE